MRTNAEEKSSRNNARRQFALRLTLTGSSNTAVQIGSLEWALERDRAQSCALRLAT